MSVWKILDRRYNALGNNLLMRLTRYLYLYFYGAFWGVIDDSELQKKTLLQVRTAITLCREERWKELPDCLHVVQDELSSALHRFYKERIIREPAGNEVVFCWDAITSPRSFAIPLLWSF